MLKNTFFLVLSSRRYHCNFTGRVEKSKETCQQFEKEFPLVQDIRKGQRSHFEVYGRERFHSSTKCQAQPRPEANPHGTKKFKICNCSSCSMKKPFRLDSKTFIEILSKQSESSIIQK
ncbi:uncharacterized protein LOC107021209 isoform X2 [Solanum pennellii]|uniref:Uncharacterized protein LOC107021209 isoform X2 n=1 Tax=Solanum pennellii TaxID=28526 RepID=A0ABM1GXD0_SOLPN|nr:uncharacterized protein LOC107021209 isoform X2 [Solanum pennellii]